MFKALEINTRLEVLSLSNTGLTDRTAEKLAEALEKNATLRVIKYLQIKTRFFFFLFYCHRVILNRCFNFIASKPIKLAPMELSGS